MKLSGVHSYFEKTLHYSNSCDIFQVALASSSGAFALGEGVSVGRGVLTETMMSILLVFAVLQSAVDLGSPTAAFAIGFSIIVGVLIG